MGKLTVHHENNYTCITNDIGRDKDISFKAKGLLLYMLGCKDDWNFNINSICAMGTDGYSSVRSGLIELEKNGYLKRTPVRIDGMISDYEYDIYESKQPIDFYALRTGDK